MPFRAPNSPRIKILPLSYCTPKIFSRFSANLLIPIDHGTGGTPAFHSLLATRYKILTPRSHHEISPQRSPLPASQSQRNPVRFPRTSPQPFLLLSQTISGRKDQAQLRPRPPRPRHFHPPRPRRRRLHPGFSHANHAFAAQRSNRPRTGRPDPLRPANRHPN